MCLDLVSECYTNKRILQLWQSERDEFPDNKLHKIFPVLKEYYLSLDKQKRRDCDGPIAHSFITHSFLLKGEEPPMRQCTSVVIKF